MKRFWSAFHRILSSPRGGAAAGAFLGFTLLLFTWLGSVDWYKRQLLANQRSEVSVDLSLRASALSAAVNRRIDLVEALHAFVQSQHANPNFQGDYEIFATDLYTNTPGIQNLAVAPDGVVYYVYPVDGNLGVIGYNPLEDLRPDVRADVQQAIDTREVVLSGPLELVQGGKGLIIRKAVYIDDEYWGLVNMVADFAPILERAGFSSTYAMSILAMNEKGEIIEGAEEILGEDPIIRQVPFLDGSWELAGIPLGGWEYSIRRPLRIFQLGSFSVCLLLTALIYLSINRQSLLARSVRRRTLEISKINALLQDDIVMRQSIEADLREREAQYRGIFETVNDGLIICDLQGRIVDFNPSAPKMHGYTPEMFARMDLTDLAQSGDETALTRALRRIQDEEQISVRLTHLHADGTPLRVAVTGTRFQYQGSPHALMVVRDISEQVLAYELLEKRVAERTSELAYMLSLLKTLAGALELKPLLGIVFEQLQELTDYSAAFVAALEGNELTLLAVEGDLPEQIATGMQLACQERSIYQEIIDSRHPSSANMPRYELHGLEEDAPGARDLVSWLGVPLVIKDRVIGVLHLEHGKPNQYSDQNLNLYAAIADMIALALENARLYEQAQTLASLHERQRLARELHDSVSQALYGIVLGARTARKLLNNPDIDRSALGETVDYLLSLADAGLAEMRALIFELRPEALEMEGLIAALERQAAALRSRHDIRVDTSFCEEPQMALHAKEIMFRIFREAIHNTIKHAKASHVNLGLYTENGSLLLEVSDDGVGFAPHDSFPGHLGLQSMRERVAELGGEISIESAPGKGTHIRAQIPLKIERPPAAMDTTEERL